MSGGDNPFAFARPGQDGMTLRDWFAGHALAGCMGAPDASAWVTAGKKLGVGPDEAFARGMYALADAMLAERGRQS